MNIKRHLRNSKTRLQINLSLDFIMRFYYVIEILDKVLIKVCKSQEAFYFFYLSRSFLFFDCLDFIVFHLDFSSSNYYS